MFSLMRRAIEIRAKEAGSKLGEYDLAHFFANNHGTKTVGDIWASSLGAELEVKLAGDAKKIKELLTPEAFSELQCIAAWIMKRCVQSMAITTIATIAKMGKAPSGKGHIIFFEGSIANAKYANPLLKKEIERLSGLKEIYQSFGYEQPLLPNMEAAYRPVKVFDKNRESEMKNIDLTLIGAVSMAMAENVRS
jgi:hypothetical protein